MSSFPVPLALSAWLEPGRGAPAPAPVETQAPIPPRHPLPTPATKSPSIVRHIAHWWGVLAAVTLIALATAFRTPAGPSAAIVPRVPAPAAAASEVAPAAPAAPRPAGVEAETPPAAEPAPTSIAAARAVPMTWMPAARDDYERAQRPPRDIRVIVIHVSEAPVLSSVVNQFRTPGVDASAHYVVSKYGQVVRMVPDRSIAWHAGNAHYNNISIGIEHVGYTDVPGSITDEEYRASARLVAHLAAIYGIPLDRNHVIGHNEVPDPSSPSRRGGFDHHTDPGRNWDWRTYLNDARAYAQGGPDALPIAPVAPLPAPQPEPSSPAPGDEAASPPGEVPPVDHGPFPIPPLVP